MRLATWNILAPEFCAPSLDGTDYYRDTRPHLKWADRFPRLVARIQRLDADVLCLQEVSAAQWGRKLLPALEQAGYRCHFAPRPGNRPDGVVVAVRGGWQVTWTRPVPFLDGSDKVALMAGLVDGSGRAITVASAHLKWTADGDQPARQFDQLASEIEALGAGPAVIAGDLNLDLVRHPSWTALAARGWRSAYPDDGRPTWFADGRSEKTDGLFMRGVDATALLPVDDVATPPGLPSPDMPSDHLPLAATVDWASRGST